MQISKLLSCIIFDHPPPYGGGNTQAADWDRTILGRRGVTRYCPAPRLRQGAVYSK